MVACELNMFTMCFKHTHLPIVFCCPCYTPPDALPLLQVAPIPLSSL